MTPDDRLPPTAADDGSDNGDPHAAYLEFAHSLTPATRAALLAPKVPAKPAAPSELQRVLEAIERLTARLLATPPPVPTPPAAYPGLAAAAAAAGLIGVEWQIVDEVARSGRTPIRSLRVKFGCDVPSAVKRARPKLKARGWCMFRRDNHIDAKPILPGRK